MTPVSQDIKAIQQLAKEAQNLLQKKKISEVQKALQQIVNLDFDEINNLQKKGGNRAVLDACLTVLSDAKYALQILSRSPVAPQLNGLINEIIKIEEYEEVQITEQEKEENLLYQFWYSHIYNVKFYHGTSSFIANEIKHYGILPDKRHGIWKYITEAAEILDDLCGGYYSIRARWKSWVEAKLVMHFSVDIRYASGYRIPETVTLVNRFLKGALPEIYAIIETNGDYQKYRSFAGKNYILENYYRKLDFPKMHAQYKKLLLIQRALSYFEQRSSLVIFYIFGHDLVPLARLDKLLPYAVILSFPDFKKYWIKQRTYNPSLRAIPSDERIPDILIELFANELQIKIPIPKKYIHVLS